METTRSWEHKDMHNRLAASGLCTWFTTKGDGFTQEWVYEGKGRYLITQKFDDRKTPDRVYHLWGAYILDGGVDGVKSRIIDCNENPINPRDLVLVKNVSPDTGNFWHYTGSIHDLENRKLRATIFGNQYGDITRGVLND